MPAAILLASSSYALGVLAGALTLFAIFLVVLFAVRDYARSKSKVSLPVLQEMQRCETCSFWDRDLFRQQVAKHPAFVGAAEVVGPAEMMAGYTYNDAGERTGIAVDDPHVRNATWNDAGVCKHHDLGTLKMDVCEDWCPRRPSERPQP